MEGLIEKVERQFGAGDVRATVADYIRLVQLQRELEELEPSAIAVTWVDPEEQSPEAKAKSRDGK